MITLLIALNCCHSDLLEDNTVKKLNLPSYIEIEFERKLSVPKEKDFENIIETTKEKRVGK